MKLWIFRRHGNQICLPQQFVPPPNSVSTSKDSIISVSSLMVATHFDRKQFCTNGKIWLQSLAPGEGRVEWDQQYYGVLHLKCNTQSTLVVTDPDKVQWSWSIDPNLIGGEKMASYTYTYMYKHHIFTYIHKYKDQKVQLTIGWRRYVEILFAWTDQSISWIRGAISPHCLIWLFNLWILLSQHSPSYFSFWTEKFRK